MNLRKKPFLMLPVASALLAVGLTAGAQNLHVVGKTQNDGDAVVLGNLGLGVAVPGSRLQVNGSLLQGNGAANTLQAYNNTQGVDTWMWPRAEDNVMYTNFGANGWNVRTNTSQSVMFMTNTGSVGIGTGPAVNATLQINGSCRIGATNNYYNAQGGADSLNFRTADTDYAYIKGEGIGTPDDGGLGIHLGDDASAYFRVINDATGEIMRATSDGLGVGRTPRTGYKLDVNGPIGFGGDPAWQAGIGTGAAAANRNSISVDTIETLKHTNGTLDSKLEVFYYNPGATLDVHGAVTTTGGIAASGSVSAGNSDLYFTNPGHYYTGYGNTAGYAAIENAVNYNTLMILGRAGTSVGRRVDVWDYLQVNGNANTAGTQSAAAVQIGDAITLVEKPGDNGSASCDTYCNGSQWFGWVGSCVAAFSSRGVPVSCGVTNSIGLRCLCARLGAGLPPPPSVTDPCPKC